MSGITCLFQVMSRELRIKATSADTLPNVVSGKGQAQHMMDSSTGAILTIQPSESSLAPIRSILDKHSLQHIDLLSVKQAIVRIEAEPSIDLVILGLDTRDSSAYEFLTYLRRNPRMRYLPVVVTCENCDTQLVQRVGRLGRVGVVTLPIAEEVLINRIATGLADGKRIVLVVDDEPVIRDLLSDSLSLERFKVITAGSAEEALGILREKTAHAVVSDILMSGKTGLDLLVDVKHNHPNLPVILMTGYGGRYLPQDVISAGADGYFQKPFKNLQMVRMLREVIARAERNEQLRSPAIAR